MSQQPIEVGIGCLLQSMARLHEFITGRSGYVMAGSSTMGDNVLLHIQRK